MLQSSHLLSSLYFLVIKSFGCPLCCQRAISSVPIHALIACVPCGAGVGAPVCLVAPGQCCVPCGTSGGAIVCLVAPGRGCVPCGAGDLYVSAAVVRLGLQELTSEPQSWPLRLFVFLTSPIPVFSGSALSVHAHPACARPRPGGLTIFFCKKNKQKHIDEHECPPPPKRSYCGVKGERGSTTAVCLWIGCYSG